MAGALRCLDNSRAAWPGAPSAQHRGQRGLQHDLLLYATPTQRRQRRQCLEQMVERGTRFAIEQCREPLGDVMQCGRLHVGEVRNRRPRGAERDHVVVRGVHEQGVQGDERRLRFGRQRAGLGEHGQRVRRRDPFGV